MTARVVSGGSARVPRADPPAGLTAAEVSDRVARGAVNRVRQPTSRSLWAILRTNLLTRFNALLGSLCVLMLVVGPPADALFGLVIVANSAVGIVAELRAKRTLDRFQVLTALTARVLRDGQPRDVPVAEIVVDDVLLAGAGDQVVTDGVVLSGAGVEVDESLLTGESDPVRKEPGDEVLSGSFVVAGTLHYRATRVGEEGYANRLAEQARRFTSPPSELTDGVNTFLRWVTWALIPAGAILLATQLPSHGLREAVSGSVAAVVAMCPRAWCCWSASPSRWPWYGSAG